MIKIEKKELGKGRIALAVVLPFADFKKYFDKGAAEISQEIKIKGFRQGKASFEVVKQRVGEMAVLERAASLAIRSNLPEVLKKAKASFLGQPEVEITKIASGNDLEYKIILNILPEITLGEYKNLKVKEDKAEVNKEEIKKQLEFLKKMKVDGKKDEEKKEEEKKPIDDNFAKGLNFESLKKLEEDLEKYLLEQKKQAAKEKFESDILEKIIKNSQFGEIPEAIVNQEIESMLANLKKNIVSQGGKFEDYLQNAKKSEADLKKEFSPVAEKRVKISLILREILKKGEIKVNDKEIDEKRDQLLKQYQGYQKVTDQIKKPEYKERLEEILLEQKLMDNLKEWNRA